jgi:tRNA(Ile2) C34 agmatinyltransferase TiaS
MKKKKEKCRCNGPMDHVNGVYRCNRCGKNIKNINMQPSVYDSIHKIKITFSKKGNHENFI